MGDSDPVPDLLSLSNPFDAAASQPLGAPMWPENQLGLGGDDSFPWEMIGQGLEEPLPCQEVIDELCVSPR